MNMTRLLPILWLLTACTPPHESDAYRPSHLKTADSGAFQSSAPGYTVTPAITKFDPTGVVKLHFDGVHTLLEEARKNQRTTGRPFNHRAIPLGGRLKLFVAMKRASQEYPNRWTLAVRLDDTPVKVTAQRHYVAWDTVSYKLRGMPQFTLTTTVPRPFATLTVILRDTVENTIHRFTIVPKARQTIARAIHAIRHRALFGDATFQKSLQLESPFATISPKVILEKERYLSLMRYDDILANYRIQSRRGQDILSSRAPGKVPSGGVFHRLIFATSKGLAETCSVTVQGVPPKRVKLKREPRAFPFHDTLEVRLTRPYKGALTLLLSCGNATHSFTVTPTKKGTRGLVSAILGTRRDLADFRRRATVKNFSWEKGLLKQRPNASTYVAEVEQTMELRNQIRLVIESLVRLNRYLSKFRGPKVGKAAFRRQLLTERKDYIRYSQTMLSRMKSDLGAYARTLRPRKGTAGRNGKGPDMETEKEYVKTLLADIDAKLKALRAAWLQCLRHKGAVAPSDGVVSMRFPRS